MNTQPVRELISDTLTLLGDNTTEDVTEEACLLIEGTPALRGRYDAMVTVMPKAEVNKAIGREVKRQTHSETIRQVPATRAKIIKSYSKLRRRRK